MLYDGIPSQWVVNVYFLVPVKWGGCCVNRDQILQSGSSSDRSGTCFEIEIRNWKFLRILNNSRETRFLNRFIPWKPNKTAETMACSWGNNHGHFHNLTILKSESSLTNLLYCRHLILVTYIGNRGSESFFETIFWLRSTRPQYWKQATWQISSVCQKMTRMRSRRRKSRCSFVNRFSRQ